MAEILTHPSSPPPTVTLTDALKASLACTRGRWAGYTFGEFVTAARSLGVTDDMPLASIEFGVAQYGDGTITVCTDERGIEIRERR